MATTIINSQSVAAEILHSLPSQCQRNACGMKVFMNLTDADTFKVKSLKWN